MSNRIQGNFCLLFAGAVGSSKTPIAHFLSCKFQLPIFSNDAIRTEVIEDQGVFDNSEYINRRDRRLTELVDDENSFIYDASVDREWRQIKRRLAEKKYQYFIISLDLGKNFLAKLYKNKNYAESHERIDKLLSDHKIFTKKFSKDIGLRIDNSNFNRRLRLSYLATKNWLKNKK